MATQGERLEALEKGNSELKAALAEMGATLDELRELVGKAAPLSDFETLSEKVAKHEATLAEGTAQLMDGEAIAGELVKVEGFNSRDELLKAFRQIEAIASHINVRLPA